MSKINLGGIPMYYTFSGKVTNSTYSDVLKDELFSGKLQIDRSSSDPHSGTGWFKISFNNGVTFESDQLTNIDNNDFWFQPLVGSGYSGSYLPDNSQLSLDTNKIIIELLNYSSPSGMTSANIFASIDLINANLQTV
jgi:hypothetical protein